MKKGLLFTVLITGLLLQGKAQSVDFGVEVNQNYNSVEKQYQNDIYDPANLELSVRNLGGDTVNAYFYKFTMDNHFEIPLYLRFNFRKRWFVDLKFASTVNSLQMWGVSNYTDHFYQDNYGTYQEFKTNASLAGFSNADTSDYVNYIQGAKDANESFVRTEEEFKVNAYTLNAGMRFFPHKSIKMFVAMGFTQKWKYTKHVYSHIDFSKALIEDVRSADNAVDKFSERSTYFNFQVGLEFYRFRLAAHFQTGISYFFDSPSVGSDVLYSNVNTPFDVIRTYGFSASANLFSIDVGKRVKLDDVSEGDLIVSNIKRKKDRWDIGIRLDNRWYNDLSSYYASEENQLSVLRTDSILYNNSGTFQQGVNIEMITLGDVKRINWGPRVGGVLNIYLTKKLGLRASLGGSKMVMDIATSELKATVLKDSSGQNSYLVQAGTPSLRNAVYRKELNLLELNLGLSYKIIDRELFSLSVNTGFGFSGIAYVSMNKNGYPPGINELSVYTDFDALYSSNLNTDVELHEGQMEVNLNSSPDDVLNKFDGSYDGPLTKDGRPRVVYPTYHFGIDAGIQRFTLGVGFDFTSTYMDAYLLDSYFSSHFSIGYKIFRR
jgi:hypothetical protein